jgi:predicted DNA binding CopG/RHH family protein/uncharacterized DUF497 family protein
VDASRFLYLPFLLADDPNHSLPSEARYHALGKTDAAKVLFITFTLRESGTLIRVISAGAQTARRKPAMKSTKLKPIPKFTEEKLEQAFWEGADSTQYIDWSKATPAAFVNLKPSKTTISIRLPQSLLDSIKLAANSQDVPYQSLIKIWLKERVGA